ncbi:MAG TPA: ABC transporter substrate-binding protein, partial [Candidatus Dormibacteraeota bacterium]|nr:ABC transporter substrate-binding protein [Candidatus Dormibacteraeota bacterium]
MTMSSGAADRRAFVTTLAAGALLLPRAAPAQPVAGRVARVGYLTPSSVAARGGMVELRRHLRDLGYVEGRDIRFEIRAANEDFERLPDLAADLVRSGVDLIVAVSPPAIRAAENATSTIPIVMVSGTDPVAGLFVVSLARPGSNVTGVTTYLPELAGKRLEVLRECLPGLRRVAVLANLRNPSSSAEARETE